MADSSYLCTLEISNGVGVWVMGGLFLVDFWQVGYGYGVGSAAYSLLLVLLPDNVGFCLISAKDVNHGIMTD